MKNKLILALILILTLTLSVFGFAACGNADDAATVPLPQTENTSSDTTDKNTEPEEEKPTQEEEPVLKPEPTDQKYFVFTLLEDDTYEIAAKDVEDMPAQVVLPDVYEGKAVTKIAESAFENCLSLTSVLIPDGFVEIKASAFASCENLKDIAISETVSFMRYSSFSDCNIKNAAMPCDAAPYIPKSYLENVFINGGESLPDAAIAYAYRLRSLTVGDTVKTIGRRAFAACTSLTVVTIGKNVNDIAEEAFYGDAALSKVNYIGDAAGWSAVTFAERYSNPLLFGADLYFNDKPVNELVIPESVNKINNFAFYGFKSFNSIRYEGDVASWCAMTINNSSFNNDGYELYIDGVHITDLVIPDTVTEINQNVFANLRGLKRVTVGENVNTIASQAFMNCFNIIEVYNKSSLNIGKNTNNGYVAYWTKNVYTPDSGESKLSVDNDGYLIYTDGEDKIVVGYTGKETSLSLPSDITEIYQGAFYNCDNLTYVTIPSGVKSIGATAFYGCSSLIGVSFEGNENLQFIEYETFSHCTSLTSITIESNVTWIGSNAFGACYRLAEVYDKSSLDITAGSIDNGYVGYYAKAVYTDDYVSKLSTDGEGYIIYTDGDDKILTGYKGDKTELSLPDGITEISCYAFYGNKQITKVIIPDSVKVIEQYAFYGCTYLNTVTLTENSELTAVKEYAFCLCVSLKSIMIPKNVVSIGKSAFYNSGLTYAEFKNTENWWSSSYATATSGAEVAVADASSIGSLLSGSYYSDSYIKRG